MQNEPSQLFHTKATHARPNTLSSSAAAAEGHPPERCGVRVRAGCGVPGSTARIVLHPGPRHLPPAPHTTLSVPLSCTSTGITFSSSLGEGRQLQRDGSSILVARDRKGRANPRMLLVVVAAAARSLSLLSVTTSGKGRLIPHTCTKATRIMIK
ncbi:hypothetical protein E2C01_098806 [Portunus trituberculatus]|uniref:Uncharacterized protein n=1 Tax=Portunus trituberculatus TaxID=210409 RepID=A0A5B7K259_PORTR|nr:hypothetical protein [Portunus trituberculatus]